MIHRFLLKNRAIWTTLNRWIFLLSGFGRCATVRLSRREYERILASIKAIGLIEPLIVFPEGEDYVILDGVQRYRSTSGTGRGSGALHLGKAA